jgi:hypothetical protein
MEANNRMATVDYQKFIGRTGTLPTTIPPNLEVGVRIIDVRSSFGRVDVKVTPIVGSGDTWVNITRVVVKE